MTAWLFLAAYTSSGLGGLIYEVTWTRMFALYIGHTTAATSTVLAAFMGGLAVGSALAGRVASRFTPRQALAAYVALEAFVVAAVVATPALLAGLTPALRWAYADGTSAVLFPSIRLVCCLTILLVPAAALGGTFPMAVRWYGETCANVHQAAGRLYAANTTGAAAGAIAAGFLFVPALGVRGATLVGIAANTLGIALALIILRRRPAAETPTATPSAPATHVRRARDSRRRSLPRPRVENAAGDHSDQLWLALLMVTLTGGATFIFEVAWTRTFAMIIGPSTYALSTTLATFITGIAVGSMAGTAIAARTRRPELPIGLTLAAGALAALWASSAAGSSLPLDIAKELAASPASAGERIIGNSLRVAALIAPIAVALGLAFPLTFALAARAPREVIARRLGAVYALNTAASVVGSLFAGFVLIPELGLQQTLRVATALLVAGALLAAARGAQGWAWRTAGWLPAAAALVLLVMAPSWDRELLASGGYKYARHVAANMDLDVALKAGTLLYYREGATSTVSVKRLTGELSMSIDGKVDASNSGDMLTQMMLAHLPLLIHERPRTAAIVGLGSGVTLASALTHPIESVDVIEISPEVVEASHLFAVDNRKALDDPRTRLIVGDGRSHLTLSTRQYDVIISEPSNPWIAGVAALFTQEFLSAVRERLAPGGIICQWAHIYDISESDVQSIVQTFAAVFPHGTMWLVGAGDLLLVGATEPIEPRLAHIERAWQQRPRVAADLKIASVFDPFGVLSQFVGGEEIRRFAEGAALQVDDRMALEFSAPRWLNAAGAEQIVKRLRTIAEPGQYPPAVAHARKQAGAAEWRNRAAMMLRAGAYAAAYDDFAKAIALDPTDSTALAGFVRAAVATRQPGEASRRLEELIAAHPATPAPRVALSRLRATAGEFDRAVNAATDAAALAPTPPEALEQLASLYAEASDAGRLAPVSAKLEQLFPQRPAAAYYAAALRFLTKDLAAAQRLAREAIARDPAYASAHNLLGAISASLGDSATARRALSDSMRLDPADAATYVNLALLELDTGNAAAARRLFVEALTLDPGSAAAQEGLARTRLAAN
jgi:spermidine synthase